MRDRAKPIRLDFERNAWDFKVKELVCKGFSLRGIKIAEPRLTDCQVARRMQRCGHRVKDYRDAATPQARRELRALNERINSMVGVCKDIRHASRAARERLRNRKTA